MGAAMLWVWAGLFASVQGAVVINEIHYNADVKTERVEFVELYNSGSNSVDLSSWQLADAIDYNFPAGTTITQGGFVVVAESPSALAAKKATATIIATLGPTIFNRQVLSLDVAGFSQSLPERRHKRCKRAGRTAAEDTDHRYRLLLRAGGERVRRRSGENRHEITASHAPPPE